MPHIPYLEPEDVDEQTRQYFDSWVERHGFVPEYRKILAHNPMVFRAHDSFTKRMRGKDQQIDEVLKEVAHVVVSQIYDCPYCSASHGKILVDEHDFSMADIESLYREEFDFLDEPARTVAEIAAQFAHDPNAVTREHVEALHELGFDNSAVVELFVSICHTIYSSALMSGFDVDPADRSDELPSYYPGYD